MADLLSRQPYKGSRDFYPEEMRSRQWMFDTLSKVVEKYGYERVDAPILEPIEIYLAKTSEEIIGQQIYSFKDRGERTVAIRPEMTPTVSRMVAGKIRELARPVRWYCLPNLWRYERPGKGRLREHWQLNADLFGAGDELGADTEILQIAADIMKAFGANAEHFSILVNHRGVLNAVFGKMLGLTEDKFAAVARIMDKQAKVDADTYDAMLQEAGLDEKQIQTIKAYTDDGIEFLSNNADALKDSPAEHLQSLFKRLTALGFGDYVKYDPSVVRGFDYYSGMVFEVYDNHPENRRSLFGGGRYDNLVGNFVKDQINAVGFGMGDVTLEDFLRTHKLYKEFPKQTQVYVAFFADVELQEEAARIANDLRLAGLNVELSLGPAKLGKQFAEAERKGIRFVVLAGPEEVAANKVAVKDMESGSQELIARSDLLDYLKGQLSADLLS